MLTQNHVADSAIFLYDSDSEFLLRCYRNRRVTQTYKPVNTPSAFAIEASRNSRRLQHQAKLFANLVRQVAEQANTIRTLSLPPQHQAKAHHLVSFLFYSYSDVQHHQADETTTTRCTPTPLSSNRHDGDCVTFTTSGGLAASPIPQTPPPHTKR